MVAVCFYPETTPGVEQGPSNNTWNFTYYEINAKKNAVQIALIVLSRKINS